MKAVVMVGYGDVDKLELADVEEPEPGPREIKVKVCAAGINPVDCMLRRGELQSRMPLELPAILGRDVAGEVVEVGWQVTNFRKGDRVMGLVQQAYAEYVVGSVDAWAKLPDGMDLLSAGALPLVGLTGAQLAEEGVDPKRGDVVLVTGAVGAVGRVAVFTAKQRGARVIAGVRATQRREAEALGVDDVVALDDERDIERLPALDAIADTVDGSTVRRLFRKVKSGGVVGSVLGEPVEAKERGLRVRSIRAHLDPKRLEQLGQCVAEGALRIPIERTFPLTQARDAQHLAEEHGVGKVLLTP